MNKFSLVIKNALQEYMWPQQEEKPQSNSVIISAPPRLEQSLITNPAITNDYQQKQKEITQAQQQYRHLEYAAQRQREKPFRLI
ncbi:hypothetical protein JW865_01545 [Candidatus Bathyarchaeota archaeon]|nr:hypothetical protein [Candidatus Bathyarchaeota archaeon]